MSDENDNAEGAEQGDNIAQLRASYEAEKAKSTRLEALIDAGVDLSLPVGKLFAKGYDGPLDAEKVIEAATAVGAIKVIDTAAAGDAKPEEKPDADLATGEAASTGERQELANGAADAGATTPHPTDQAMDAGRDTLRQTGSREKALGAFFESKVGAAIAGDGRAVIDVWGEK